MSEADPRFRPRSLAPGVHQVQGASCLGIVRTSAGAVLIDSGNNDPRSHAAAREVAGGAIAAVVYTHGHQDHVFRRETFAALCPEATVYAHADVPQRLRKYELIRVHTDRINGMQFGQPAADGAVAHRWPDRTYGDRLTLEVGDVTLHLVHARGETDDATYLHLPEHGVVFTGDLVIGLFPNAGNPYKSPRYVGAWIDALDAIAALRPRVIAMGHNGSLAGAAAAACLADTASALRLVRDAVVAGLNRGVPLERLVPEVTLPEALARSPYLGQSYSRLELAVVAAYRELAGWYDGDPSDVLPLPRARVSAELLALVPAERLVERAEAAGARGEWQVALELLQLVLRSRPDDPRAGRARERLLADLAESDGCLQTRAVWSHFGSAGRP